jgi:glycosyltransferase involved in cell wall biosynthesis
MPSITVLLHTYNDSLILGRALETLYPCEEILIVDHGSRDATLHVAQEYGAHIVEFEAEAPTSRYLQFAKSDWILCLEPRESLTEALAASLFEWKLDNQRAHAFNVLLREENAEGWSDLAAPQTRLVRKSWLDWQGWLPVYDPSARTLGGPLLRFMLTRP